MGARGADLVNPSPPLKPCAVKWTIQTGNHNAMPCAAGMDELVIADVDTDMIDIPTAATGCIEEDQITRAQMTATDVFTVIGLLARYARQAYPFALTHDILRKSGTIKRTRPHSSPNIAPPKVTLGNTNRSGTA